MDLEKGLNFLTCVPVGQIFGVRRQVLGKTAWLKCLTLLTLICLEPRPAGAQNAPASFSLISPANLATRVSTTTTLTWQAAGGAVSYAVHICGTDFDLVQCLRGNPSDPNSIQSVTGTSFTPASSPLGPLATNRDYYWWVEAIGASGARTLNTGGFQTFSTGGSPTPALWPQNCSSTDSTGLLRLVDNSGGHHAGRIPLVLIHGIHGVPNTRDLCHDGKFPYASPALADEDYWLNFRSYFSAQGLDKTFDLYRVIYRSDQETVAKIGQRLREVIDDATRNHQFPDGEFVILAHSMGGLVARSYMATTNQEGVRGGDRVKLLI